MLRTVLFALAGVLLGLGIHIVVILALPLLAQDTAFQRAAKLAPLGQVVILDSSDSTLATSFGLDPNLTYAMCRLDLAAGPGEVSGTLPLAFWSVAVLDPNGTVLYSTTSRGGGNQTLDLGIFDPAQTRLLAEQRIDVAAGLLIVEAPRDDVLVVVRLAPEQPVMRERYQAQLERLSCRNLTI